MFKGPTKSEQMYKKRLKKWNIRKRTYRKSQPPSTIETSPTTVTSDTTDHDEIDIEEITKTPTSIPETTMALIQPSNIGPYANLQLVLGSVYAWSQCKIESHGLPSDPMSKYLADPGQIPVTDSRTMYRTFELVFDLWKHGRGNLAGMAARKGFYALEYVLTDDHPDLVWHVLDTIYDMLDTGHLQLLRMFLDHATILGQRQLPAQHPLLKILQHLQRCDFQTDTGRQYVQHLLRQAWLRNVDILSEQIGSLVPHHLWLYEQLIWDGRSRLRRNSDLGRSRVAMTHALKALTASLDPSADDPDSERLRVEALMLEFTQMDLKDKQEAERLARELLAHTGDPATATRSSDRFHAYARKMLARVHEDRADWAVVEENLKMAINKREAAHGTNNNLRVVRDMWVLAAYFRRVGKQAEADQVVQDALHRAQLYLEDGAG